MERAAESGLEIRVPTEPEVTAQPDGNKYYWGGGGGESNEYKPRLPDQSVKLQIKSKARYRVMWVLAVVAVVCLALALGAGFGVGLKAQHKSSSVM